MADPEPSGRRGLRRPHRVASGAHAELDSRAAVIGRRGATVPASRYAVADQPADEPHREPRLSERRPATVDTAESGDPGGRSTRIDRPGSRRRAHYARDLHT